MFWTQKQYPIIENLLSMKIKVHQKLLRFLPEYFPLKNYLRVKFVTVL